MGEITFIYLKITQLT